MFFGSLVLGITVLLFAAWLHWNDTVGWPQESYQTELDHQYLQRRTRGRRLIHAVIAFSGIMILVAAFAGPGRIWIVAWTLVIAALMLVVVLAAIDALRTHRYHVHKLPEIRREVMGEDD